MTSLPNTIALEQIGELTFNDRFQRYETSVELNDTGFVGDISLDVESHTDLNAAKMRLTAAVNAIDTLMKCAKNVAVEALHDVYNRAWRGDKPELSRSEFADRLTPCSLWVDEDSDVGISLSTDDLFPGQAIRVDFDEALASGTARLW